MYFRQAHPDFSPVGWHLGHIAYTESLWMNRRTAESLSASRYDRLFAADGLPKAERENLPAMDEILAYLGEVRSQTITHLNNHPNPHIETIRLWHWLIQHEAQHAETMAMVLAIHRLQQGHPFDHSAMQPVTDSSSDVSDMVLIKGDSFLQGSNTPDAIDNEQPAHRVRFNRYWLDRTPVTGRQYSAFVEAGGYQNSQWWSDEGWQWRCAADVSAPLYHLENYDEDRYPVCGVSAYEAEAYARFVGKRLPTEGEWEYAASADASCKQMLGNVWEWTSSEFLPYAGFHPFPYAGYSQAYFDGAHRVLRGGSWASPASIIRPSFRTWYHPHRREVFAGFRCALS